MCADGYKMVSAIPKVCSPSKYTEQKKKGNTYFIQKYLQKYLTYENNVYIKLISIQFLEALCKGNADAISCL